LFSSRGCIDRREESTYRQPEYTHSCCKLASVDWLKNLPASKSPSFDEVVEIRFKNGRKDFLRTPPDVELAQGDIVAAEGPPGHDIGIVSLVGPMVSLQMKAKKVNTKPNDLRKVYRKARPADIEKWALAIEQEEPTMFISREAALKLGLEMKISDVEIQGDRTKATFYYTAEERVDFRELIKVLAEVFSVRVEMRQVGMRHEAGRLGGLGTCGRELCCSSWLTNFRSVSTNAARVQQLTINPSKLSGQCNKLKCCLNFENDCYLDCLKAFPEDIEELLTKKGIALFQKTDILKGLMGYAYKENPGKVIFITIDRAKEIREANIRNVRPDDLLDYQEQEIVDDDSHELQQPGLQSNLEGNLNRFDKPKGSGKRSGKRKKNRSRNNQ